MMARRKPNTVGGGASTNFTGLTFEAQVDLPAYLKRKGLDIHGNIVKKNGKHVAELIYKYDLYRYLKRGKPEYVNLLSKNLLPDQGILVGKKCNVIEVKNQNGNGSVDEKLQTCDFKKKQYLRLLKQVDVEIEYYYRLADWFKDPKYKDCLDYIESVGCKYYFDDIPLADIGLE